MKAISTFGIKLLPRPHSILNNTFTYVIQGSKNRRSLGAQGGILISDMKSGAAGDGLDFPMRQADK
jgi:hypothetical protein